MAIKNERKSITENSTEVRLKNKLKEDFNRFVTEADEEEDTDEDIDLDLGDEEDLDLGDEEEMPAPVPEEDELGTAAPIEDLSDNESEQVDEWLDDLLRDTLDNITANDDLSLDTETPAADLDPMGADQRVNANVPLTVDDVHNIIDSDDSLAALENELAELAMQQDEDGDLGDEDLGGIDDDTEDLDPLAEAKDPMDGVDEYFTQGYEGEDLKDELQEDVELAPDNKEAGFKPVAKGLNDKVSQTVTPTPGARTKEDIEKDQKGVVTEAKKAQMLVNAAKVIEKQQNEISRRDKKIADLKLENYRLVKVNGLLSVAGDMMSKETRVKISEGFDSCASLDQVNKLYNKITEQIKGSNRPSLNESTQNKRTKVNKFIQESNEAKEKISIEQQRRNMLMGLPTEDDAYFA